MLYYDFIYEIDCCPKTLFFLGSYETLSSSGTKIYLYTRLFEGYIKVVQCCIMASYMRQFVVSKPCFFLGSYATLSGRIIQNQKMVLYTKLLSLPWKLTSYMRQMVASKLFVFKNMIVMSGFQQPKFYIKTKRKVSNYIPYSKRLYVHVNIFFCLNTFFINVCPFV